MHTDFSKWFHSKALQHLKHSLQQLNKIMDEQIQSYKMEEDIHPFDSIPPEYLKFHAESCINSFKINLLSELEKTCFNKKFSFDLKNPIDEPIKLKTKNTLMQRAQMPLIASSLHSLPQLAFLDIETDGTNIRTANILQISIIKPIINIDHNSLSYFKTWSSYIKPWEDYSQIDNKAYHINHIGDKELENAIYIDEALINVTCQLLDTVIVGYNIHGFDLPIIKRDCEIYNEYLDYKYSIDLYPAIWKDKKQTLKDAIKAYNVPLNPNPHDATADASCCIDLLSEMIERNELPNNEEDLLDLFTSPNNLWQHHYGTKKVIETNPNNEDYAHLHPYLPTPASSLKRKLSQISTS